MSRPTHTFWSFARSVSIAFYVVFTTACSLSWSPNIVVIGPAEPGAEHHELTNGSVVSFGQPGYAQSQELTFTLQNAGLTVLEYLEPQPPFVELDEDTAGDHFELVLQPTERSMGRDSYHYVIVRFNDRATTGPDRQARLRIATNDPNQQVFEIILQGKLSG